MWFVSFLFTYTHIKQVNRVHTYQGVISRNSDPPAEKKFVWLPVLAGNSFADGALGVVCKLDETQFTHDGRSLPPPHTSLLLRVWAVTRANPKALTRTLSCISVFWLGICVAHTLPSPHVRAQVLCPWHCHSIVFTVLHLGGGWHTGLPAATNRAFSVHVWVLTVLVYWYVV